MFQDVFLAATESVCPQCLQVIPAQKIRRGQEVYLVKECSRHGQFSTLIWQGAPDYQDWGMPRLPVTITNSVTPAHKGCPYDCGLCPEHRQETCCVLMEVTADCNLNCPICFASSQAASQFNPPLAEIEQWLQWLLAHGGPYNLQLSGGEPTVRDDLPQIISLAKSLGFAYLQLNTNGLRLAREPQFVRALKQAGLSSVFLQFDGTDDAIYQQIRGRPLLQEKLTAIRHCTRAGLGVVLVPTLVPGVNMTDIGAIIRCALERVPGVRGIHFQPVSYFGRYPGTPPRRRITIPDILQSIEKQTDGMMRIDNFIPAGAENAYCTFHGNFILMPEGQLKPLNSLQRHRSAAEPVHPLEEIKKSRSFVAKQWSAPASDARCCDIEPVAPAPSCCNREIGKQMPDCCNKEPMALSMDELLRRVTSHNLCISGMAFQDAWNLDLDRLRDCKLHVFSPPGRLIPFCAYNLTSSQGRSIYRP